MKTVFSIFKFVFLDNLRSFWALAYMLFYAASTYGLIYFTGSFTRSMVSLMNIVILITPLVSTMMTSMYYFNKTDFVFLLLAQPVKRAHVFLGMFFGLSVTLALSVTTGILLGMVFTGPTAEEFTVLSILVAAGGLLSFIFSAIALFISVAAKDKLKGIGLAIFVWLFMAVIYDGLMLMYFIVFSEYPIEQHAIVLSVFNPIDLSRIFVMLQLDVSALMGYSGAVFSKFFGNIWGVLISLSSLLLWIVLPVTGLIWKANRKDY